MHKKIFITGSSSGIGADIAKDLIACGHSVVINGRDEIKLELAHKEMNSFDYVVGDFSSPSDINNYIDSASNSLKGIDVLICNVGSGKSVPPGSEDINEWNKVFDINFLSATTSIECSRKHFNKDANIICISSICGLEIIPGAPITYTVAKAALNAYVKGVSKPLGKEGIRINAIAPGNILFPGSSWEEKRIKNPDAIKDMLKNSVPLNRFGQPEEVAKLVSFLISEEASFITGSIFTIDGGQTSNI